MAILVSLSGLPGVGKTTLAKALATRTKAIHLRVDTVEAALKSSALKIHPAEDAGYLAIASIAKDNLLLGLDVIADTVNPIETSRKLWVETATAVGASLMNVEVICSDKTLHRTRVETRRSDIDDLAVPDWEAVSNRIFDPWRSERLIIDTSHESVDDCAMKIEKEMARVRAAVQ